MIPGCRKYVDEDWQEVLSWYISRKMSLDKNGLSQTGFIVPGIACGWLMKTDAKVCIIEPLIANSNTDAAQRDEALDTIVEELLKEATLSGHTLIYGFSNVPSILNRASKWGFKMNKTITPFEKNLSWDS